MSLALARRPTARDPLAEGGEPSRKGRPHTVSRAGRIRCVGLMLTGFLDFEECRRTLGVHRATLYRWQAELLADGEPDTEGLRRLG